MSYITIAIPREDGDCDVVAGLIKPPGVEHAKFRLAAEVVRVLLAPGGVKLARQDVPDVISDVKEDEVLS